MTDTDTLINAAARFMRHREPTEEMLAHREVVKRARQAAMPAIGTNDNKPEQI